MRALRILLLFGLFVFTANSYAANTWTGYKHITKIETGASGGFLITFDTSISSACSNSSSDDRLYIYANQNSVTADGLKALLATTLSAFNAGKEINVLYDNSSSRCYGTAITVSN